MAVYSVEELEELEEGRPCWNGWRGKSNNWRPPAFATWRWLSKPTGPN